MKVSMHGGSLSIETSREAATVALVGEHNGVRLRLVVDLEQAGLLVRELGEAIKSLHHQRESALLEGNQSVVAIEVYCSQHHAFAYQRCQPEGIGEQVCLHRVELATLLSLTARKQAAERSGA